MYIYILINTRHHIDEPVMTHICKTVSPLDYINPNAYPPLGVYNPPLPDPNPLSPPPPPPPIPGINVL